VWLRIYQHACTFTIPLRSLPRGIKNVSDKICRENEDIHYLFNIFFFENGAVYEMILKNMLQPDRIQVTVGHMRFSCWLTKATDIQSEYTGCPRRNVPDFGRVFLMLKYTDITQNTYVQI